MQLSKFGEKLGTHTGILSLMDDLGRAMSGTDKVWMLGGGNPAAIPAMQRLWRQEMERLLKNGRGFDEMMCNYDTPQGRPEFIEAIVKFFRNSFGWPISSRNVAITNGSQNTFFYLFNMLAGEMPNGGFKKILLPVAPEYIGYADQGVNRDIFRAFRPNIELSGRHEFKYHVDFDKLRIDQDVAAIAVSRPTNPSGNVLTDDEIAKLSMLAKSSNIPLIIDNAYGAPFPGILFEHATPVWDEHIIVSLSLSKLGLPGARTGVVIASEEIAQAITAVNAVVALACGNVGQAIVTPMIADGSINSICRKDVLPFYQARRDFARNCLFSSIDDRIPFRVHRCEGALFFWLWLENCPISSAELYERLKNRGVVVVSGHYFFYGLDEPWQHANECLRINYTQSEEAVSEGLRIIADELRSLYTA